MSAQELEKAEVSESASKSEIFLLDDSPAQEDAFGPHKRIAAAINQLVTDEPGGKAIALIGTWGGGKSTVINLLKASTKETSSEKSGLEIFVFDAWAHEGDPLRRTFLEKIIAFFEAQKWISKDKWDKRLAQLSRRYKETTTTSTPQLTKLGSICGLLLFVVAIGLAMVGGGSDQTWYYITGFILTLLPPIGFLVFWLFLRSKLPRDRRGEADDVLSYLANKQIEKTKTATIEESEPTSVEFQSWFCELAQEALTGNRKILLAIDNLDRIDPIDALKLWAAMRTFVDFSDAETPSWASKLWVLVAFDEEGIKRLWKKEAEGQPLATTFLDKTFQIRFRIPAPLLSNWRDFLMKQLKKAFPNGKDDDFYKICRIYAILNAEKRSPTPRDMKVFVNQIGAVSRTAPEQVPLPQQALYALLIEKEWDPLKELPESPRLQSYLGIDWKENSAALFYSMPRDKAIQVLLGEQVEKAMTDGKPEQLNRTEMAYIVDRILEQRLPGWRGNEPYMIGRAAYALTAQCISETLTGQSANARLLEAMQSVMTWPQLDKASGMGISILLKQANDGEVSKALLQALKMSSPITGKTQVETNDVSQWVMGVSAILDWLVTTNQENLIADNFTVANTPHEYLIIISTLPNSSRRELWKYFRPGNDPLEIVKALNEAAASGTLDSVQESNVNIMLEIDCPWPWDKLVGLSINLQSPQTCKPEDIGRNIRILLRLRKCGPYADSELQKIVQGGWLFIGLSIAKSANNDAATASAMLFALLYDSEAAIGQNQAIVVSGRRIVTQNGRDEYRNWVGNPNQQKQLFDALFTQALALQCVDELLAKRRTDSIARLTFDAVLQAFAKQEKSFELYSPAIIVKYFQTIKAAIDVDTLSILVKDSIEQSTLEEELVKSEFSVENYGLYKQALNIKRSTRLLEKIIESLKLLSKDNWILALNGPGDLIPLVADLIKWEAILGISHQLQDALNEFAGKMFSERIPDHISTEICRSLLAALTADQRAIFKKNLRDKVIAANSTIANLTILFPDALSDCETLVGRVDEFVREGLRKVLDRGDAIEYEWMKKVLQSCNQLLAQCPHETRQDFVDRVRDFDIGKLNDECKKSLKEIRHICGIPADQEKKTEESK